MRLKLLRAAIIAALGFAVYFPALHGAWLWDDPQYVPANPLLHDPARWWKAWFAPASVMEYYPLQETVIFLQWQLWGDHPFPYHATNVLLHIASSLLVWRLFSQLGLRFAYLGGLIFVLHPANVESVAWISELKNTLSLPLFLLAVSALIRFDATGDRRDYLLSWLFYTLALLAKISMAPFPFAILLYAWWKRGRVEARDLRVASPFLASAVLLSSLTVFAYLRYGEMHPAHPVVPEIGGAGARMALAVLTTSFYLARCLGLGATMPMVPQWPAESHFLMAGLLAAGWTGLLVWSWRERATWGRHVLLGLGFFLLMIAPFCGVVAQSYMYFAWVMDHFIYIAMIGVISLGLGALQTAAERTGSVLHAAGATLIGACLLFLGLETRGYAAQWKSGERLWTYAVRENPRAWLAWYNLGNAAHNDGEVDRAIERYRTSIRLNPAFDWSHDNLGICLASSGRLPEAMAEYREAIRLRPNFAEAHNNLANALTQSGDLPGAIAEFHAALAAEPNLVAVRYNLALALIQAGRTKEAADELRRVIQLQPDFSAARVLLQEVK